MWDMLGLESLFDVDQHIKEHDAWEKEKIVAILKESKTHPIKPAGIPLQMMILRARYNSQRAYEIYEFNSTMAYDELKDCLLYTSPSPRDRTRSRMPSSA